jgi:hypothetical protein
MTRLDNAKAELLDGILERACTSELLASDKLLTEDIRARYDAAAKEWNRLLEVCETHVTSADTFFVFAAESAKVQPMLAPMARCAWNKAWRQA